MSITLDNETLETIFTLSSRLAIAGWIILAFLPRRWPVLNAIPALIIPCLISVAYSALIFTSFSEGGGDFSSLAGVRQLFSSDAALLAGWLHYLAFDLFVGTVIAKQADEIGIHRVIQLPFLFLTLMFAPAGFLLFHLTRGGLSLFGKKAG